MLLLPYPLLEVQPLVWQMTPLNYETTVFVTKNVIMPNTAACTLDATKLSKLTEMPGRGNSGHTLAIGCENLQSLVARLAFPAT